MQVKIVQVRSRPQFCGMQYFSLQVTDLQRMAGLTKGPCQKEVPFSCPSTASAKHHSMQT
jgi:hypothetical protein